MSTESPTNCFSFPDRCGDMTGSVFASTIMHMPASAARELAIFQQFELGNIPSFMRTPRRVTIEKGGHRLELDVLPDVLCVGTDADFLRVVLMPRTAQRIADLLDATLLTPFLSDQLWKQADVRIDPMRVTMPPTAQMSSTQWFVEQDRKVERERAGRTGLIAGHKKNIVLANSLTLADFHDRVAIYGWHQKNGVPIQGLNPSKGIPRDHTHSSTYVDYSHGVPLGARSAVLDGRERDFLEVARDAELSALINGLYGPLLFTRYAV